MKQAGELWGRVRALFAGYPEWVSELLVGVFSGLIIGFLCRLVGRTVLIILGASLLVGVGLHYFGVVTFNTRPVLEFLGLTEWPTVSALVASIFDWCKLHFVACVAIILGFIFGWKMGH